MLAVFSNMGDAACTITFDRDWVNCSMMEDIAFMVGYGGASASTVA